MPLGTSGGDILAEEWSIQWASEQGVLSALETYRVRPEGMSLEEWYMSQGEIVPPPSEIPSGPPGSWGSAALPTTTQKNEELTYDVPYVVPPPPAASAPSIETVEDIMVSKGFEEGIYGGWYKPITQETRPIAGPVKEQRLGLVDTTLYRPGANGTGNGGDASISGLGDIGTVVLLLGAAMVLG
jgi:hypothetical protein